MKNPAQEGMIAALTDGLRDNGFVAEPVRDGVLVFMDAKDPDLQTILDAIPELENHPMRVEKGAVFIEVEC